MIVVVGIPLWAYLSFKSYKRKLRRVYDEIKIGDRYKFEMPPLHPFDESHVYKATILPLKIYCAYCHRNLTRTAIIATSP